MKIELIFLSFTAIAVVFSGCSGKRPSNLGAKEGSLVVCPDKPNCVSSMAKDKEHFIDPLKFTGDAVQAKKKMTAVLSSMKRSKIITEDENYIHAEFTSAVFRFVDDVEFLFDDSKKLIHVRSASRIGHSDMGVNRKRVEAIRKDFMQEVSQ